MRKGSILRILLSCVLCSCLVISQAICMASGMYQITEQELQQLDSNLTKLKQISEVQKTELNKVSEQLTTVKSELITSKAQLQQAQISLNNANKLLQEYEKEEKRKRLRIKAQRNAAWSVAGILLAVIVAKS